MTRHHIQVLLPLPLVTRLRAAWADDDTRLPPPRYIDGERLGFSEAGPHKMRWLDVDQSSFLVVVKEHLAILTIRYGNTGKIRERLESIYPDVLDCTYYTIPAPSKLHNLLGDPT